MNKSQIAKKLNAKGDELDLVKLEDLKPNSYYTILDINKFSNKFGKDSVLVTIKKGGKKVKVFLPSKYSEQSKFELENLIGLEFRYEGKEKGKKYEYHKIHFNEECEDSQDE